MARHMSSVLLAIAFGCCAAQDDRLQVVLCAKTDAELQQILKTASERGKPLDAPADADSDTIRALLYKNLQEERPDGTGMVRSWPGCEGVAKPPGREAAPSKPSKPAAGAGGQSGGDMMASMADMLFKTKDKNKDGKLSKEEMKELIEATNAQAAKQGEGQFDMFANADKDMDGFLDKEETKGFFEKMSGASTGGGAAAKPKPAAKKSKPDGHLPAAERQHKDMAKLMFQNMDTDKDGLLSFEEMRLIIEKTNQQAANQAAGESGEDFFKSLDADGDGSIDMEEAKAFFAGVEASLNAGKKEEL